MNIFEQSIRAKLRFPSTRGPLTTEDLFELPLTSKQGFDLDTVARAVNVELKGAGEESFVAKTNPARAKLALALDTVKAVIEIKQAEIDARNSAAAVAAQREKLTEALARKQDAALESLSAAEIEAQLKALG